MEPQPQPEPTLVELPFETAGRYHLVELLGKGSTGEVWRAADPQIGRPVAIKILNLPAGLAAAESAEWEQRFHREARASGRLSHPGIVAVHDVGKTDAGRPYIVMELVKGHTLENIMKQGPDPEAALHWGAQIADALDAAHAQGIVHRDIKPANILIDTEGRARVADFGIARLTESELTREGLFLGSPAYTSPEQIRGGGIDGRSDLFSLGATMYAVMVGVRPFQGDDLSSLAYAICHMDPAPPRGQAPGLPPGSEAILMKALAKDPASRYQTGREMADAFRTVTHGQSPAAAPGSAGVLLVDATDALGTFLRRSAEAGWVAANRACAAGRQRWVRGWQSGPRTRQNMMIGLAALLLVLLLASLMVARVIERRRETPGQKIKRFFSTLGVPAHGDS